MTEELTIEGKQYISSKRASELSRYAQDYIGQLARAGLIDARRIGGLWYIHFESLKEYKDKADTFVPKPPENIQKSEWNDTLISFDGRDYISAGRAAEITGYHQDYVGQLARAGKILSRQIGNRWYVDREALLQHKEEKDDLLGAVQAQSVGIQERIDTDTESSYNAKFEAQPLLSYKTDQRAPLIPDLNEWQPIKEEITPAEIIPIRVMERKNDDSRIAKFEPQKNVPKIGRSSRKTIFKVSVWLVSFTFVVIISVGALYIFSKSRTPDLAGKNRSNVWSGVIVPSLDRISSKIGDFVEPIITRELFYSRAAD